MNKTALSFVRSVAGRQFSVLGATRAAVVPQMNCATKRGITEFSDSSWAADRLEKMGVKLVPEPPKELEMMDENFLETPDDKIIKLVDKVLALNVIEMCQFQRRFQV